MQFFNTNRRREVLAEIKRKTKKEFKNDVKFNINLNEEQKKIE